MFDTEILSDWENAVSELESSVTGALALDLHSISGHELTRLLAATDIQKNRVEVLQRRVIAEFDQRRLAGEVGSRSTADAVAGLLRLSGRDAANRVQAARTYGPRRALTGQELEPELPFVAAALDTGTVSLAHGNVIAKMLHELPADIDAEFGIPAQEFLLEEAKQVDPPTLAKIAVRLRDTLDQDGAEDRVAKQNRDRSFVLVRHGDGTSTPRGKFTPALTTALLTLLDPLAAPRPSELGERNSRSYGQRMHDALLETTKLVLKSGTLPASGGIATTIQVTVTAEQLRSGTGMTCNAYGDLLPISELAKLAVEAELLPVVFNDLGGVTAYGRAPRLAPPNLRRALAARDKGCVIPGCTRSASQSEAHHVNEWVAKGGETNIDEMVLVCDYDHDTFEARGWQINMVGGVPWCIPPEWLDPDQVPRRNTAHDVFELVPIDDPTSPLVIPSNGADPPAT